MGSRAKPFERIEAREIVDRAMMNLKVAIDETGAVIKCDALPVLDGDPVQLTQLFQNLLFTRFIQRLHRVHLMFLQRRLDHAQRAQPRLFPGLHGSHHIGLNLFH